MSRLVRLNYKSEYFKDVFIISSPNYKTILSLTVGFYLAIFPVPGTVTLLCIIISFVFRLNLLLLQGMNWLLTPVQLALIYPFLKTGRILLFNDTRVFLPVSAKDLFHINPETIIHFIESVAGGILVWGIVSLITGYFLFRLLLKLLAKS